MQESREAESRAVAAWTASRCSSVRNACRSSASPRPASTWSAAGRQASVVAGNIRALITGGGELARYEPPAASIIVPIGPEGGAGQRADGEDLVPAETVAQLKGRDMMVQRFAELLGLST